MPTSPGRRHRPIFDCIDGAADNETTYRRNTAAFEDCDLVAKDVFGWGNVPLS